MTARDLTKIKFIEHPKGRGGDRSGSALFVKKGRILGSPYSLRTVFIKKLTMEQGYSNEKRAYERLKDEDYVPKLLYYDDANRIIAITDCGSSLDLLIKRKKDFGPPGKMPNCTNEGWLSGGLVREGTLRVNWDLLPHDWQQQLTDISTSLSTKYKLTNDDAMLRNICLDRKGKIRVIDWEHSSERLD